MKVALKAKSLVFYNVLFLCSSRRTVHVFNMKSNPRWQEKTMVTNVLNLQQHGFTCKAFFVPRHILNTVYGLADFATRVPVHQSWVHTDFL